MFRKNVAGIQFPAIRLRKDVTSDQFPSNIAPISGVESKEMHGLPVCLIFKVTRINFFISVFSNNLQLLLYDQKYKDLLNG